MKTRYTEAQRVSIIIYNNNKQQQQTPRETDESLSFLPSHLWELI